MRGRSEEFWNFNSGLSCSLLAHRRFCRPSKVWWTLGDFGSTAS